MLPVVAVGIVRLQHTQPVPNRDAGCDYQEATGEAAAVWLTNGVEGLPRDQHSHHGCLSRARGKLQGDAEEGRVGRFVGAAKMLADTPVGCGSAVADGSGHLGEPDCSLDGLDLAKKTDAAPGMDVRANGGAGVP